MTKPDLQNLGERYTLAPDILLTPSGPQRDMAISVANGKIVAVAPARTMPDAIKLPQQAIVPGFVAPVASAYAEAKAKANARVWYIWAGLAISTLICFWNFFSALNLTS